MIINIAYNKIIIIIYMSFNFKDGKMIASINDKNGKSKDILFIDTNNDNGYDKIILENDNKFLPIFDDSGRSIVYICGASGSGKSTLASELIKNFNILFPESNIYIFSRLNSDPAFDKLEKNGVIIRIPIDNTLIDDPIDVINDFDEYSLVLFDDVDTINDKKILSALNNVKLQILEIGRHKNIYCIITSHLINGSDKNNNRTIMNEMSSLVIFPKGGGSVYQQKYYLKNHLGFNNKQIDKIINSKNTRWVYICKNFPQYVLTQQICYLIK